MVFTILLLPACRERMIKLERQSIDQNLSKSDKLAFTQCGMHDTDVVCNETFLPFCPHVPPKLEVV